MSLPKLEIAISPCPNDVFIFSGLILKKVEIPVEVSFSFYDIEELNMLALKGSFPIIKASFALLKELCPCYQVLSVGSALGFGTGPVLVAKELPYPKPPKVALPGFHTTAYLLFNLFFKDEAEKVFMPFYQIIPSLLKGEVDLGVLIHEGRFVYKDYGLKLVADLGSLWEETYRVPLPLGGIFVERSLSTTSKNFLLTAIQKSLDFAWANLPLVRPLLKKYAQELDDETIFKHIKTFVNDFTYSLKEEGKRALRILAQAQGLNLKEEDLFWE